MIAIYCLFVIVGVVYILILETIRRTGIKGGSSLTAALNKLEQEIKENRKK